MTPFLPNAAFRQPRGWIMGMDWLDLLFIHWKVPADTLRPFIPAGLELDLHQGQAWIGLVPFFMSAVRPRFLPDFAGLAFPELNLRTYVTRGGIPGVWFFSLDAANRIAVRAARRFFHLPYFDAAMQATRPHATADPDFTHPAAAANLSDPAAIRYHSRRTHFGAPEAELRIEYAPTGPAYRAAPGTLDDWLTARYCFYAADTEGSIFRCPVHHKPWRLQPARARIDVNTMTAPIHLTLPPESPHLLFSRKTQVVAWLPERLP